MKSLKTATACTTMTVITTGLSSGRMTEKNSRSGPAPSTMAASSSSRGMEETKARNSRMQNDRPKATFDQDHAGHLLEQAEAPAAPRWSAPRRAA